MSTWTDLLKQKIRYYIMYATVVELCFFVVVIVIIIIRWYYYHYISVVLYYKCVLEANEVVGIRVITAEKYPATYVINLI